MDELEESGAEVLNTSAGADPLVNSSDKGAFPEPGGDIVTVSMGICVAAYMKDGKTIFRLTGDHITQTMRLIDKELGAPAGCFSCRLNRLHSVRSWRSGQMCVLQPTRDAETQQNQIFKREIHNADVLRRRLCPSDLNLIIMDLKQTISQSGPK